MAENKYGNKKTIVDGIKFDSKAEAKYYEQLKWLKAGKADKRFQAATTLSFARIFQKER
jgi:hypothetical protein